LSNKGWIRSRAGHNVDLSQTTFKEGDGLKQVIEGRTVWPVVVLDSHGRTYTLDAAEIPGGRGDGVPVASLIELQNGAEVVAMMTGLPEQHYLLSNSGGYGFIAKLGDMVSRIKAGKVVMMLKAGERTLPPVSIYAVSLINPDCKVLLATDEPRLLAFTIGELEVMAKGRGLQLISLSDGIKLEHVAVTSSPEFVAESVGKRGATHKERLRIQDINNKRGRKGKVLEISGRLKRLSGADSV
ncbi:MAG: DNA topoisomerase IV subunit A, partial [Neisseria animaloris]|nr:DNA topoisomerase IV subunit A [Neisseria animaloris]